MKITVKNLKNDDVGEVEVSEDVFNSEVKSHLLHDFIKMQLANRRRGTASVKERGMVSASGKKPWAQKGTGRARAGASSSPLWRGGGVVFGPIPKKYNSKLTKKVRKSSVKSALSMKLKNGELTVVDDFSVDNHKTKGVVSALAGITSQKDKTLLVIHERNENVFRGSRNIPNLKVILPEGLNVYDLVLCKNFICTQAAIMKIQERVL